MKHSLPCLRLSCRKSCTEYLRASLNHTAISFVVATSPFQAKHRYSLTWLALRFSFTLSNPPHHLLSLRPHIETEDRRPYFFDGDVAPKRSSTYSTTHENPGLHRLCSSLALFSSYSSWPFCIAEHKQPVKGFWSSVPPPPRFQT